MKIISRNQKFLGFLSILLCGLGLVNEKILANEILDAGGGMTCAIQADNTVVCWGKNSNSPSGTFSRISVSKSGNASCGILADNSIMVCWGGGKKIIPPEGTFSQVSVGQNHACGLRTDNTVACWGENDYGQTTPPQGSFSQISAANNFTCGIQIDGTLACWGSYGTYEFSNLPLNKVPAGTFSLISAGNAHICGIRTDNSLVCWGWLPHILEVKNGSFMVDGKVYKWGNGVFDEEVFKDGNIIDDGRATPPWREGTFHQVEGGNFVSCWLRSDQAVVCMGPNDPPGFEGLRPPGSRCECVFPYPWSGLAICQCESPSHLFSQITAGSSHACGIKTTDGTVKCWGIDLEGRIDVPLGLRIKSSDPTQCLLYGVHDDGTTTQFFISNSGSSEVSPRGQFHEHLAIKSLDIHPMTNQLYAVASDSQQLYQVRNGAQALVSFGEKMEVSEIEALAFHPDGNLWGWSEAEGLFKIENGENNEPDLSTTEIILPYQRELKGKVEVKDISWNRAGTILYGVGKMRFNSSNKSSSDLEVGKLWAYHPHEGKVNTVCDSIIEPLGKVEALETLPEDTLLLGFSNRETLAFWTIEVSTCKFLKQEEMTTKFNDIKGLAYPDCSRPLGQGGEK